VLNELVGLQGSFWILPLMAVAMFVSLCFIEGVVTKRPIGEKPPRELVTDLSYWLISPVLRQISRVLLAGMLLLAAAALGQDDAPRMVKGFGPLAQLPFAATVVIALIVSDLSSYWEHRLMHRVPFLWRFHAIHHSAKTIRWSTIGRVHPINEIINYVAGVVPCLLIGLPLASILTMIPVMMWWAVLAHSDFKWSFGRLGRVFVSPVFHRWHHTHSQEGGDSNFANVLSLWDRVFGSYYLPKDKAPQVFGLDVDDMPDGYVGQLLYPFNGGRQKDEAVVMSSRPAPERSS